MVYVDTSALVPMFLHEPSTGMIHAWIESANRSLAISDWSVVEFVSAVSIKVRRGHAEPSVAKLANAELRDFAVKHCTVLSPRPEEFRRAAELCSEVAANLRGGDALHLAIAEASKVDAILCLDEAMCEQARALRIKVIALRG